MSVRFLKRKYFLTHSSNSEKLFLLNNLIANISLQGEMVSIEKDVESGLLDYEGDRVFVGFNYLTHNILIQESNISAMVGFKNLIQLYGLTNYLLYKINLIENNLSINKTIENKAYYFEKFTQSVFLGLFKFDILSDIKTQENNISVNKVIDTELYLDGVVPKTVVLGLEQKYNGLANLSSENVSIIKNVNNNLSLIGDIPKIVSIQLYNYSNNNISIQENNFSVAKDIVNEPSLLGTLVFDLYIQTLLNLLTKDIMVQESNLSIKTNINNDTNILGVKTIFNDTQATSYITHDINVQGDNIQVVKSFSQKLEFSKDYSITIYLDDLRNELSSSVNTQGENIVVSKNTSYQSQVATQIIRELETSVENQIIKNVALQDSNIGIVKSFTSLVNLTGSVRNNLYLSSLENKLNKSISLINNNIIITKNVNNVPTTTTQMTIPKVAIGDVIGYDRNSNQLFNTNIYKEKMYISFISTSIRRTFRVEQGGDRLVNKLITIDNNNDQMFFDTYITRYVNVKSVGSSGTVYNNNVNIENILFVNTTNRVDLYVNSNLVNYIPSGSNTLSVEITFI